MIKVLVLMGGTSAEREVSLRSGKAVAQALAEAGYIVETLDFNQNTITEIKEINPDVVFIALHGENGEDGRVQGYLDILEIPYTGSGHTASAIGMDKLLTKKILQFDKIPTGKFISIDKQNYAKQKDLLLKEIEESFGLPVVIKAPTQGSSIGTYIVKSSQDVDKAINEAFTYDNMIFAEQFINGTEVTVSIIGNDYPEVLPIIEITSVNEFFDYESKYTKGMCEHIIPARIADDLTEKINTIAIQVYKLIGCRGFARVDFMIDGDHTPYVLEINTIPGMTEMSLVPDAARAKSISYVELCDKLVKLALEE